MQRDDPAPSVWLLPGAPGRPTRGGVDRDAIAQHAAALLDERGPQGLTMRALGERLGVSAMACYAHVRHKDDVLELAQDSVMGEVVVPRGDWQDVLRALAETYRLLLVRHPWMPLLAGRFLNAGPKVAAMTTAAAARLTDGGLPTPFVPPALSAAFTLAHGHGAVQAAWEDRAGGEDGDRLTAALAAQYPDDPVLRARAQHGTQASSSQEWDFALDCLIAGIAARVAAGTGTLS